jgi:transcriptional regulator with XRE-family HTH domain
LIVEKIRSLCNEKKITLAELERNAGIGNGVIRRWDDQNPRSDKLKLVADELNVSIDELLKEG